MFLCSMLFATSAFAETVISQTPFTNVPKTNMNYDAIECLRTQNVIKGYLMANSSQTNV